MSGREQKLAGHAAAPGIAIGPIFRFDSDQLAIPDHRVSAKAVAEEIARLQAALDKARRQLRKLKAKASQLAEEVAGEVGQLLDTHLEILSGNRLVQGIEARIRDEHVNAEAATAQTIRELADGFAALDDPYLAARAEDVRQVGDRLLRSLQQRPYQRFDAVPDGSILLAEELSPSDVSLLDPARVAAIATAIGSSEGHAAILARALGLPAVLAIEGVLDTAQTGDLALLDGSSGELVLRPAAASLADFQERRTRQQQQRRAWRSLRKQAAVTRDGVSITLQANLELPREAEAAIDAGASGIGLLRTEFLFMNRPDLPDEDEQYAALREVVERMDGRPVTIRTLDIGSDKVVSQLPAANAGANPALGLRAVRLCLHEPRLLETQLAAILRAGAHGPVRIMLPMVTQLAEVAAVRDRLVTVARRLQRRHVRIADPLPALGIMIETPGAALTADALARVADFFSIGSNDLTQYTLAVDRSDEAVVSLFNPLHPAVLRLLQFTIEAALRADRPVSLCGEIGGRPEFLPLLLGLGLRELSLHTHALLPVKQRIRSLDLGLCQARTRLMMDQGDPAQVRALLDEFNSQTAGDAP